MNGATWSELGAGRPEAHVLALFGGRYVALGQSATVRALDATRTWVGLSGPGIDDFDKRLPWGHQAAKYRLDDESVFESSTPKLDILERQQSAAGITWVRAGKAPIRKPAGDVIGILGMYELLDSEEGRKLYAARNLKRRT